MKNDLLNAIANLENSGKKMIRAGIVIVFLWIGILKFFPYEADCMLPFVANSPFMSAFYSKPQQYTYHTNKEGELVFENRDWNIQNRTYEFSYALGTLLISIAVLVAVHPWAPLLSMLGSILVFVVSVGTLSFLITTPESWMPHSTDVEYGFPFLSARGHLLLKDLVLMGASIMTMSESAALHLKEQRTR